VLAGHGVRISMDGRGRWLDNVFIERLWRSVKHEEVYLKAYENLVEARRELGTYFDFYNHRRRHQGLADRTPDEAYWSYATHASKSCMRSSEPPRNPVQLARRTRPPLTSSDVWPRDSASARSCAA
jgi:hypothetical protein